MNNFVIMYSIWQYCCTITNNYKLFILYCESLIFFSQLLQLICSLSYKQSQGTAWWNHSCQHSASACDLGSLNEYNSEGARHREEGGKWKKVCKKERGSICHLLSQEFLLIQNWVLRIPVELLTHLEVKAHGFRASSFLKANVVYHQRNLHLKCWWFSDLWFMADSSPLNQSSHIYSHPPSLSQFQTIRALMVQFSSDLCQIHCAFSIFQLVHII